VLEGAATVNLGAKMMKTVPFLGGFGAYFLVDQQLSRVPRDANGDKDYWNPALVWGAFFQIAPLAVTRDEVAMADRERSPQR
jgi:hypothetical protein